MKSILKYGLLFFAFIGLLFSSVGDIHAGSVFLGGDASIPYCQGGECGLKQGVDLVKTGVRDVKTDGTFSQTIQDVIIYLLGFLTLVAVIFIIYAGFRILVSSGDEEVIKKSKSTILYVIIGILVIWFAWAIAIFAVGLGSGGNESYSGGGNNGGGGGKSCHERTTEQQCEDATFGVCNWNDTTKTCSL